MWKNFLKRSSSFAAILIQTNNRLFPLYNSIILVLFLPAASHVLMIWKRLKVNSMTWELSKGIKKNRVKSLVSHVISCSRGKTDFFFNVYFSPFYFRFKFKEITNFHRTIHQNFRIYNFTLYYTKFYNNIPLIRIRSSIIPAWNHKATQLQRLSDRTQIILFKLSFNDAKWFIYWGTRSR